MGATPDDVTARVAAAYNHAADFYDHAANAFWDRFGRRTVERIGIAPGARVLDVCCGAGASALPAAHAAGPVGSVLGVDLAAGLLGLARSKAEAEGLTNCAFRVADVLALEEPASFDDVICVFGLFFIPDMAHALRTLWTLVRPGGTLAVTTWGSGVFDPVNTYFWNAVREVRPDLYKSFNAWDRLGEISLMERLFADAGVAPAAIAFEKGTHPVRTEHDVTALLMGTGYRGTLEQLPAGDRARVIAAVVQAHLNGGAGDVRTDVIYATCRKSAT